MEGIRKLELRQLDAHVAVAVDGWQWRKLGAIKTIFPPHKQLAAEAWGWVRLEDRDCLQWSIPIDVPHYSTDHALSDGLVKRFDLRVSCERKPKMSYKRSKIEGDPMTLTPVATPEDEMVTAWTITGGRIDATWWDEELVGVCVHVLRMKGTL